MHFPNPLLCYRTSKPSCWSSLCNAANRRPPISFIIWPTWTTCVGSCSSNAPPKGKRRVRSRNRGSVLCREWRDRREDMRDKRWERWQMKEWRKERKGERGGEGRLKLNLTTGTGWHFGWPRSPGQVEFYFMRWSRYRRLVCWNTFFESGWMQGLSHK